jgi:peptide deformylase
MKQYNPYDKYASTDDIKLDSLVVEEWSCELVEPKHPALHTRATLDPFSGDIDWATREKEMLDLMHSKLGVGLAAPQVGSGYNMFVMEHSHLGNIGVYKPSIIETEGEVQMEEGCLSFPMLYLYIRRPERIKVTYLKADGETRVETWMDGIDARCFLHEYDHLQGKLYLDEVSELKLRRAKEKRDKYLRKVDRIRKKVR